MRRFRVCFLAAVCLLATFASETSAAPPEAHPFALPDAPAHELRLGLGAGGPAGFIVAGNPEEATTSFFTGYAYARFRLPKMTPVALELNAVVPCGFGVNLLTDVIHLGRFRAHFFDIGIFWNAFDPVSVRRVRRSWDLTLGTGAEVRITERWAATFDWRVFLPNPYDVITGYGDFSRLVYAEALKGGQTWLGASYSW